MQILTITKLNKILISQVCLNSIEKDLPLGVVLQWLWYLEVVGHKPIRKGLYEPEGLQMINLCLVCLYVDTSMSIKMQTVR